MIKTKLYRPLNALIVQLTTDIGPRFFLLDTGCPISFARQARQVIAGERGWVLDRALKLERPPFSLGPLSERLGLPIEGFIGLKEIAHISDVYFDFDRGELSLGASLEEATRSHQRSHQRSSVQPITLTLNAARHHPIMLMGVIDPAAHHDSDRAEPAPLYLDLGSRFIIASERFKPHRTPQQPQSAIDLITPEGNLRVAVSDGHTARIESTEQSGLCVATGAPPHFPAILGVEWLTRFNVHLSLSQGALTLWPRAQPERLSWEELSSTLDAPPFELTLDPDEWDQAARRFWVTPRAGAPLPMGVTPMTP